MTATARDAMIAYLQRQLVGPSGGEDEVISDPPDKQYTTGILFPRQTSQDESLAEDVDESTVGSQPDDPLDDPISLANQWMPSSMGISAYVVAPRLDVHVVGAWYEQRRVNGRSLWHRQLLPPRAPGEMVSWDVPTHDAKYQTAVLGGRASVRAHFRWLGRGSLVTIALVNEQMESATAASTSSACLTQAEVHVDAVEGRFEEYPRIDLLSADDEEEELILLYRALKVYGVGHGCAVSWAPDDTVKRLSSTWIPTAELPPLTPRTMEPTPVMELARLADERVPHDVILEELGSFIAAYENWIRDVQEGHQDIPVQLADAKARLNSRMHTAARRMRDGVNLLKSDAIVMRAFRMANLAMLQQMHHSKVIAEERRMLDRASLPIIDYLTHHEYRWHPFQLGFVLLTLRSVADEEAEDRDLADLIWFPTGGGKTEAYLLTTALQVFVRRLRLGNGGAGTVVITRYTLRLLTTQQFQRAAALVCACELIRRTHETEMGTEPISVGLWVGGDASPNTYSEARQRYVQMLDGVTDDNFLQLDRCPWCGTELLPEVPAAAPDAVGVSATDTSFRIFCPYTGCPFHSHLPVNVVDDYLYANPPTVLVSTVDKFARLAWTDGGSAFFGLERFKAPSLIIQDELHLISGPLGTTVGIYESAVAGLLEMAGARPKVIASTATIRRSADQVGALYGKAVALFPPSGLREDDSFFARRAPQLRGRLYAGVMSQHHTPSTALIHVAAALAQAPVELGLQGADRDAYWTQVVYHNSLRELGKTVTFARDDIPARIQVIAEDQAKIRQLDEPDVVELTSNVASQRIPDTLARLLRPYDASGAIGMLLATNMIQVGIDVPRLGLMLVNGQPKMTSEYIQASSRVGRDAALGLVVTAYSATKPRDRSHYETFLPYHQALYRYVEPTSVTPFSLPSRERALHAAFVILVRHGSGLRGNDGAGLFDRTMPSIQRAIAVLLKHAAASDPAELDATKRHLERIVFAWDEKAASSRQRARPLYFASSTRQRDGLLKNFGESGDATPTLHSMRSVDQECSIEIVGAKRV